MTQDVSAQALSLARIVDRLGEGCFVLTVAKQQSGQWMVSAREMGQEEQTWQLNPRKPSEPERLKSPG